MLIDCDTCTVRGQGCDDCVVTVLLGAPPGWRDDDVTVVPLARRPPAEGGLPPRRAVGKPAAQAAAGHAPEPVGDAPAGTPDPSELRRLDSAAGTARSVVELDDVERRAVRALADFGLVPPLRHQDALPPGDRHVS